MGEMSKSGSSMAPAMTSLMRMLRLCAKFARLEEPALCRSLNLLINCPLAWI
jgi:hypothetical protein